MFELARWAQRVGEDVRSGKLKIKYTYEEFKNEVQKIPPTTDFSRLAKDAMATRLEQDQSAAENTNKRFHSAFTEECDNDCDIEILEPCVLSYGERHPNDGSSRKRKRCRIVPSQADPASKAEASQAIDYSKWTTAQLQEKCVEYGLKKSGTRDNLVERLHGPKPPALWLARKLKGEYVPARYDSGATALLVALFLLEQQGGPTGNGMTKEEVYVKAEELEITKNPFSGGTTQTGPYHYDGWSNMGKLLVGDPPLVLKKKNRFFLTRSSDISGYPLAEQLHKWCHEHNKCKCGQL